MKYIVATGKTEILVNNRSVPGIVGMVPQSCGGTVTYLRVEPQLNGDVRNMDLRIKGEVFVLADGSEVALPVGAFERCCNTPLTASSYLTLGAILQHITARERVETATSPVCIETAVKEYLKEHLQGAASGWNNGAPGAANIDYLVVDVGDMFTNADLGSALLASALGAFLTQLPARDYLVLNVEAVEDFSKSSVRILMDKLIKNLKSSVLETSILSLLISEQQSCCCLFAPPLNGSADGQGSTAHSRQSLCPSSIFRLLAGAPFFRALRIGEASYEGRILAQGDGANAMHAANNGGLQSHGGVRNKTAKIAILAELEAEYRPYHCVEVALRQAGAERGCTVEVVHLLVGDHDKCAENIAAALEGVAGVLLPGGFGSQYLNAKLAFVEYARTHNIPFLGICMGYQLAIIEFARNVLKIKDATSEEFDNRAKFQVVRRVCHIRCANTGRDIFLGNYPVEYRGSAREIYSTSMRVQRFRHRYALDNMYRNELEKLGMLLVGKSTNDRIVAFKLRGHRFFAGVQYHPELGSTYTEVDPIISAFVYEALEERKGSYN